MLVEVILQDTLQGYASTIPKLYLRSRQGVGKYLASS